MAAEVTGCPASVGKELMGVVRTNRLQVYFLTKGTGFAEAFFTLKIPYSYTVRA